MRPDSQSANAKRSVSTSRTWIALIFALILMLPLFSFPRPTNVSSIPWKVELAFSLFTSVLIVLAAWKRKLHFQFAERLRFSAIKWPFVFLLAFALWSGLSISWSGSPTAALHHTLLWLNYGLVLLAVSSFSSSLVSTSFFFRAFSLLAFFVFAICLFDYLVLDDFAAQEGTLRIRYGKYAELFATIAPFLFSVAIMLFKRRVNWFYSIPAALAWIIVMLSLSKGGFIAGLIGLVIFFAATIFFSQKRFSRPALVIGGLAFILTVVVQIGFSFFSQVPSTTDYISGASDATRSTSNMRVYTWKLAWQMFASNPVAGVGADNFGTSVNAARRDHSKLNPADTDSRIGEDFVFERAHNEGLQVLSEVGAVGFLLFIAFGIVSVILIIRYIAQNRRNVSPVFCGCLGGIPAFAVSSMFSSFSFRAYQNGIVFFILLAIAFREIAKSSRNKETAGRSSLYPVPRNATSRTFASLIFIPLSLAVFSLTKAAGYYLVYSWERSADSAVAMQSFEFAGRLDPDNPGAFLANAERASANGDWENAAVGFRKAIDHGLGVSVVYSFLANAQEKAGRLDDAENTLTEAISIFPRSTFLRARYVIVLEKRGKNAEAGQQMALARDIDERQANGWYAVIKDGILNAHLKARNEPSVAPPPELLPANAIYAYADEKYIY